KDIGEYPLGSSEEIEKEAKLEGKVLRPLSAKLLAETEAEKKNLVNREKLYSIEGRGRKKQMELAKKFKIDYPQPAGGCLLCEKEYCKKLKPLLKKENLGYNDIELLGIGRHFLESEIILGKDEKENKILQKEKGVKLVPKQPGPTALIRTNNNNNKEKLIEKSKDLIQKYSKHEIKEIVKEE
ncbi:MAG: hypothetical protein ACOC1P_05290, partial [Minisyncoccales bacterium]